MVVQSVFNDFNYGAIGSTAGHADVCMVFANADSGERWVSGRCFFFGYDQKADWTGFRYITIADNSEESISPYTYLTTPKLQLDNKTGTYET